MKYSKPRNFSNIIPCAGYGILCGFLTGTAIFLFKLGAKKAEEASRFLYEAAKTSWLYICIVFALLIALGAAMSFLHKKIPEVKGGGIPRSEGVLRGVLSFRWFKTLWGTVAGSMISFFCGLPLGSEGPAVLIGTSIGGAFAAASKGQPAWERYVMTGGAGAGFAVATGSPLSGILFALEEIHKHFTPMLVLTVSTAVLSATFVNKLLCSVFGLSANLLELESIASFQLAQSGWLLALGVIVALAVGVFDASISLCSALTRRYKKHLTPSAKVIFVFIVTGVLALCFADGTYSGHDVILEVVHNHKSLMFLTALLLIRLLMMLFATNSGVTGGIFIPTLAIGALVGALAAKLFVYCGMSEELFSAVVLLGMCAFIGGTLRAPLTASVLFVELTGQFLSLFYVALVIFTASLITELLNQIPFYDRSLENMEEEQNKGKQPTIARFEAKVSDNAFVVGKSTRDILWPASSVILSITQSEGSHKDMDRDGEAKLYAGDVIVLQIRFFDETEIRELLAGLVGTQYEIIKRS